MSCNNSQPQASNSLNNNSIINNNGESFYQNLQQSQSCTQIIVIDKQYDGVEKLLNFGQKLVVEEHFITIDQNTKKYYLMYVTNYRIVIDKRPAISIPYGYIQEVKLLEKCLKIILKTGIYFDFYFDFNNQNHNIKEIQQLITQRMTNLPFCLTLSTQGTQYRNIYDSYAQIQRMKVDSRYFSVFKNVSGKFCPTYPLYFIIPKGIQISNLNQVKKCRYYSRIPVMSFYNQKSGAGIWRSAKRKNQICEDILKYDISYLRQIYGSFTILQLEESTLIKSHQSFQNLTSLKLCYFNLVKYYYQSLQNPQSTQLDLFKVLARWYEQINRLITTAYNVVRIINQGKHVILQEVYAIDRVPQILMLSSIIMDPFYRTFQGLSILIEKQFVSYGHPFQDRCGFNKNKQYEISPIFIQVLQCIHQLIVTHPSCFEYSSGHIAQIAFEVYTTRYKNFISKASNPKRQKSYNQCPMNIWDQISKRRSHYNFHYDGKDTKKQLGQIRKKPSIKEYVIWVEYFDKICKMQGQSQCKQSVKSWQKISPIISLSKRKL